MRYLTLIIAALSLSACGFLQPGIDWSADKVAQGLDWACEQADGPTAMSTRMDLTDAINSQTEVGWHTPTDCNRDGASDFDIDPMTGLSVRP